MVAAFHVGKVPPDLPSIRSDLGASLRQAGWLLSTVNLITAVSGMAIAVTADRLGHRRLVLIGTAVCLIASLCSAFAGRVETLLIGRVFEGLGFIAVVVALPPLLLRILAPRDQRLGMSWWSTYMPAGAGGMMLVVALLPAGTSWRVAWLAAAGASAIMLAALLVFALPRRELDRTNVARRPVVSEMLEVATSPGPLAIAICFGAYSCCWFAVIGFLPTLMVERSGFATSTAAIIAATVTIVNVLGNLAAGWLLHRGVPRVAVIVGASLSTAICTVGIFSDALPDLMRLVLAGLYSAVIGAVAASLFAAVPVHAGRPQLVGAATGLLMQGSNIGALLGPPITAALVSAGGWPAAGWLTGMALLIVAGSGVFLHRRERRKLVP